MSKHDDGGPAYPIYAMDPRTGQPINGVFEPGKTLLDWFAGQIAPNLFNGREFTVTRDFDQRVYDSVARQAYKLAAAMIAEKRRREGGAA